MLGYHRWTAVSERKIGLALSSGGARGTAFVGILKVLEENGIVPDVIAGSSIGAEIGAAYAAGVSIEEMEAYWRSTSWRRVVKTLFPTVPWSGWSSGREVSRFLRGLFGDRFIEDLPIPYAAVATDLETGEAHPITSGPIAEAIRASLSVPGLFVPVWLDGHLLIDGGVSDPIPVDVARALGADIVIAVDVLVEPSEAKLSGIPAPSSKKILGIVNGGGAAGDGRRFYPSVFAVLFQMSTIFQKRVANLLLATNPPDVLIRPDFSADPPCYSDAGGGIEAGEEAARRALPEIRAAISRG